MHYLLTIKNFYMKKQLFLLLTLFVFTFNSCIKDKPEDLIIGDWNIASIKSTNCNSSADNVAYTFTNGCTNITQSGLSITLCMKASFLKNGSYSIETKTTFFGQTETETETGTYTISGNILKTCPTNGTCNEETFTISESTMSFSSTDATDGCTTETVLTKI